MKKPILLLLFLSFLSIQQVLPQTTSNTEEEPSLTKERRHSFSFLRNSSSYTRQYDGGGRMEAEGFDFSYRNFSETGSSYFLLNYGMFQYEGFDNDAHFMIPANEEVRRWNMHNFEAGLGFRLIKSKHFDLFGQSSLSLLSYRAQTSSVLSVQPHGNRTVINLLFGLHGDIHLTEDIDFTFKYNFSPYTNGFTGDIGITQLIIGISLNLN
ncbi:MAG: hypothetical protein LAT68_08505 [Cyclobacteriaceae bacterium]|nr:hypothetical protein [Cyclobacteriaceae bacterium]MCH8516357.1 hypothetical protein [Cyclobacteriaceae bacterium]